MQISPISPITNRKLSPEFSTQLTKTYKDEDFHLRRLTDQRHCLSVDQFIYVANKNAHERVKMYRELFPKKVSEFQLSQNKEKTQNDDFILVEITKPEQHKQTRLGLSNLPDQVFEEVIKIISSV